MGFESTFRFGSEAYLAKDHHMPERLLRMIICGWYTRTPEEGKEKFLLGACEIGPEGLSRFEAKQPFADGIEFPDEAFFDLGCCLPGNVAGFELLPYLAES